MSQLVHLLQVGPLGGEDSLEEGMATHSSIPAWEITWTEAPGGLWSMESQESDTTEATEHTYVLVHLQPCSDQSLFAQAHHNQLSVSTGSKSMDSTNHGSKKLRQKIS